MGRYLLSFVAVLVLVIGATWIWVVERPMAFLAPDYALWRLKKEMARELPPGSIAILGDSRALAGLVPERIGPDVFNLALGGGTAIDTYALGRILVSSPHPPRAVILSLSPLHCVLTDSFWNHSVKYGLLDWKEIEEVRTCARRSNDLVDWSGNYNERSTLFGPVTAGDTEAQLKIALFSIRFPSFYFPSLVAGGLFERQNRNWEVYHEAQKSRGYYCYTNLPGSRELCPETKFPAFTPSPLLDNYLAETIDVFQQAQIPVYFIATPLNEISVAALHPGIAADYGSYIKAFETRYPNFHRLGDPLPTFPWSAYGDPNHLNAEGALHFSDQVAATLRAAGVEK